MLLMFSMSNTSSITTPCFVGDRQANVLAEVYEEHIALAIWQRSLSSPVRRYAGQVVAQAPSLKIALNADLAQLEDQLAQLLPVYPFRNAFIDDVFLLGDMFSCLFDLQRIGLRLAVLTSAMCPKFHVDRVPCRLLSTFVGSGSQWLSHDQVQRDGTHLNGHSNATVHSLDCGDVALLKGEAWQGNEGRGLVHRSPMATQAAPRLVLTLDFA